MKFNCSGGKIITNVLLIPTDSDYTVKNKIPILCCAKWDPTPTGSQQKCKMWPRPKNGCHASQGRSSLAV